MKQVSLSALRQDVIISRQAEAVIVICINHIREVVHPIAVHHIAINRPSSTSESSTSSSGSSSGYNSKSNSTNKPSYSSGTKKSTTTKKSTYDSYDDGYDDIYMDGDYDYDRYDRDSDYADGVDDAMDEYGEDW